MKKILPFIPIIAFLFTLVSCGDREKEPLSSLASSTSTAGQIPPSGNYYPMRIGTKWAYDIGNNMIDTTTLVRDSSFAGRSYKFFKNSTNDYFIREENGIYYRREVNNLAIPDATGTIERTELRTDLGVGKVWNDDLSLITGGRLRYENVIDAIERTRYVKGIKYEYVLKVRTRIYTQGATGGETIARTFYNYYCRNKGLIETIGDGNNKRLVYIGF
jgi:hypothetical protein